MSFHLVMVLHVADGSMKFVHSLIFNGTYIMLCRRLKFAPQAYFQWNLHYADFCRHVHIDVVHHSLINYLHIKKYRIYIIYNV